MIAIFSFENDPTTDRVINWLNHLKADFVRINSEDISNISYFDLENGIIKFTDGQNVDLNKINIAWYRRWESYKPTSSSTNLHTLNKGQVYEEIRREANEISEYIFHFLSKKKWLSNPFIVRNYNKLKTIEIARKVGLTVPPSAIIGNKEFLIKDKNNYITKSIADGGAYRLNNSTLLKSFTDGINSVTVEEEGDDFFPSLIQEKAERFLELRIFFIENTFYATAMMVGDNKNIDVKLATGANESQVNFIPYELSADLKNKLKSLMKQLQLNLGTFDLILDKNGEIHFIEMNPVGQFLGYSFPCNYMLEKIVAEYLIKNQ